MKHRHVVVPGPSDYTDDETTAVRSTQELEIENKKLSMRILELEGAILTHAKKPCSIVSMDDLALWRLVIVQHYTDE